MFLPCGCWLERCFVKQSCEHRSRRNMCLRDDIFCVRSIVRHGYCGLLYYSNLMLFFSKHGFESFQHFWRWPRLKHWPFLVNPRQRLRAKRKHMQQVSVQTPRRQIQQAPPTPISAPEGGHSNQHPPPCEGGQDHISAQDGGRRCTRINWVRKMVARDSLSLKASLACFNHVSAPHWGRSILGAGLNATAQTLPLLAGCQVGPRATGVWIVVVVHGVGVDMKSTGKALLLLTLCNKAGFSKSLFKNSWLHAAALITLFQGCAGLYEDTPGWEARILDDDVLGSTIHFGNRYLLEQPVRMLGDSFWTPLHQNRCSCYLQHYTTSSKDPPTFLPCMA